MSPNNTPIPVNLITGFLGVGKTTAIAHLLEQHPAGERWAVLVNEFGEVGVDGQLLQRSDVVVQEVPGGCLCCVAAPTFTTALNRIIRQQHPDRILIEPSGLGHPAQVLETLSGPLYAGVLDVRATICLLDARHLGSVRHREHPNFIDQIHVADILIANQIDRYASHDTERLEDFVTTIDPPKLKLGRAEFGRFDPAWLDVQRSGVRRAAFPEAHAFLVEQAQAPEPDVPQPEDWRRFEGERDGFQHVSWLLPVGAQWSKTSLQTLLQGLAVERKKMIVQSAQGWLACNQDQWSVVDAPGDGRSRLEVIDARPIDIDAIEAGLRAGLLGENPRA